MGKEKAEPLIEPRLFYFQSHTQLPVGGVLICNEDRKGCVKPARGFPNLATARVVSAKTYSLKRIVLRQKKALELPRANVELNYKQGDVCFRTSYQNLLKLPMGQRQVGRFSSSQNQRYLQPLCQTIFS